MPRLTPGAQGSPNTSTPADRISDGRQGSPFVRGTYTASSRRTSGTQGSPVTRATSGGGGGGSDVVVTSEEITYGGGSTATANVMRVGGVNALAWNTDNVWTWQSGSWVTSGAV